MKTLGAFLVALALAAPASAQPLVFRIFALGSSEQFAATQTFDAAFDTHTGKFWGGGIELLDRRGFFIDVEYSRFEKTGERAFLSNGQVFKLGIPLTVTISPIDVLVGYRLNLGRSPFTPYLAIGASAQGYKESSPNSDPGENVDTRKTGAMFVGGVEVRLLRMFSVSADVADTHVTGILGSGGISKQAGETDAGGLAARVRVIIGR